MQEGAFTLWLFDLAGTLFRDCGLVLGVFRSVAEAEGLAAGEGWFLAHMGMKKRQVFTELLEANDRPVAGADLDRLERAFDDAMIAQIRAAPLEALPGARALLEDLRGAGVRVGYTTGFSRRVAEAVLADLGIELPLGAASDEVERGRPAPDLVHLAMRRAGVEDAARVVAVGDTPSDLRAGGAAGCGRVIGVGNGTHPLAALVPVAEETGAELVPDLTALAGTIGG